MADSEDVFALASLKVPVKVGTRPSACTSTDAWVSNMSESKNGSTYRDAQRTVYGATCGNANDAKTV
jgi:hypothetical protein